MKGRKLYDFIDMRYLVKVNETGSGMVVVKGWWEGKWGVLL